MNEALAKTLQYAVDWLRGSRDYVRIADVLAVAPVPPGTQRLELFFHAVTNCRGRWMPLEEAEGLRASEEVVASLKVINPNGTRKWSFVVDRSAPITSRIADFDEDRLTSCVAVEERLNSGVALPGADRRTALVMTGEVNIWEHIVASAKALGLVVYPDVRWYVLYIRADIGGLPRVIAGRTLTMWLRRMRQAIYELEFAIDGTTLGTIGVCDRAG